MYFVIICTFLLLKKAEYVKNIHTHNTNAFFIGKGKAIPLQACTGSEGSRRLRLPKFLDIRHMKVVSLSALHTGRLYPFRKYSWYSFILEPESTPGP